VDFRKLYQIARPYGLKRLSFYAIIVVVQLVAGMLSVLSVAPLMSMVFSGGKETSYSFAGYEFSLSSTDVALYFCFAQLFLCLVNISSDIGRNVFVARFSAWMSVRMMNEALDKPYAYFTRNEGSVVQQTVGGMASLVGSLVNQTLEMVTKSMLIVSFVLVAMMNNAVLSISIALVGAFYYLIISKCFRKLLQSVSERLNKAATNSQSLSMQLLQGVKMMRISGRESYYVERFKIATNELAKYNVIPGMVAAIPKYIMELILMISIVVYLAFVQRQGNLSESIEGIAVLVFVAFKAFPLKQAVFGIYTTLSSKNYVLRRVGELLDEESQAPASVNKLKFESGMQTRGLEFRYSNDGRTIKFPDINIRKGQSFGIKGPSGCGKSTLMDIILGLYSPSAGEVIVDGKVVSSSDLRSLHPIIGYVGQDPFLVNASIAENIALCAPEEIDLELVEQACRLAELDQFIKDQEEGYNTFVGDRGVRLSGGQKQRIAIARALYHRPSILLFDEATSALDDQTERRIMDTIYSLPRDITVVMIAHRLSTLDRADEVISL